MGPDKSHRKPFLVLAIFAIAFAGLLWFLKDTTIGPSQTPDTKALVNDARKVLKQARLEHSVLYDPTLNERPLPILSDTTSKKALFIAKFLPLVAEQNERILAQREMASNATLGSPKYNALTHSYGLKIGASRQALLRRIDKIPESLTLAQAAIESGWGLSRFAQQGHAYFGERTYKKDDPGIEPKGAKGFKVKSFANASRSIRSFMKTINTHPAYRDLRAFRAQRRANGQAVSGIDLAKHLTKYSEIGDQYVQRIMITIRVNKLDDFDGIEHVDH